MAILHIIAKHLDADALTTLVERSDADDGYVFMDDGADTGDILSQYPIKITDSDTAETLYRKIVEKSLDQIIEFLPLLVSGNFKKTKQSRKKTK